VCADGTPRADCCLDVVWLAEDIFATCGADKLVNVLRIGDTKPLVTLSGHTNEVNQIKYHAGAQLLASCSDDRTARIWAVAGVLATPPTAGAADAANAPVVLRGHKNNISTVDWCPGAAAPLLLATTSFDGTARLWDSATGDCLKVFADHKTPVFAVAFSPDGRYLTTGGGDGWLIFYDVQVRAASPPSRLPLTCIVRRHARSGGRGT
jgi:transducin (beta)-like 1